LTSIRSDYDLLYPLYKLLHDDKDIDFRLLVTGAHLSASYGYTYKNIINDGFTILAEVETLINSDSRKAKIKTGSLFLLNTIDIVAQFNPDAILYAGDREDVIMGALLGLYLNIPTIHFYGGDHEQGGHEDTVIRHATSKISTYHFVACNQHKERLLKMGEPENRIFIIGAISLDRFTHFTPYSIAQIEQKLSIKIKQPFVIVIYHPSPHIDDNDSVTFENILKAIIQKRFFAFVSYPNTDQNHNQIIEIINQYKHHKNFFFYYNLPRDIFISLYKQSQFIIGNSSSGIYEAASVPIPAINVGTRQKNRMANSNVIFTDTNLDNIIQGINIATSEQFLASIKDIKNIYGDGNSAKKAYRLIKTLNLQKYLKKVEDPLCI